MAHAGKLDYFIDAVFNYPTLAECYKVAALAALNKFAPGHPAAPGVI
jgi:NAD(P) transhydrogenase